MTWPFKLDEKQEKPAPERTATPTPTWRAITCPAHAALARAQQTKDGL